MSFIVGFSGSYHHDTTTFYPSCLPSTSYLASYQPHLLMLFHLHRPTLAPDALLYSIYIPGDARLCYFSALWINRIAWTALLSNPPSFPVDRGRPVSCHVNVLAAD